MTTPPATPLERAEAATPLPDNPGTAPASAAELDEVVQPDPDFTTPVDVEAPTGDDDDYEEVPDEDIDVTEENYESLLPSEDDEGGPDSLAADPNTDVLTPEAQASYDDASEPEPQESYEPPESGEETPAHDE